MKSSPFEGGMFRVTSPYGIRVIGGKSQMHAGIDIVGTLSQKVCAVTDGTVIASRIVTNKNDLTWEWGNYVCIKDTDGFYQYYCHLSARLVEPGQEVRGGDIIGIMGNTGKSNGAHTHFEVRNKDRKTTVNTAEFLGIANAVGTYEISNAYSVLSGEMSADVTNNQENDGNVPSDWAKEAFDFAKAAGIIFGDGNNVGYRLHQNCTREEVLTFIYRFYRYQIEQNSKD